MQTSLYPLRRVEIEEEMLSVKTEWKIQMLASKKAMTTVKREDVDGDCDG